MDFPHDLEKFSTSKVRGRRLSTRNHLRGAWSSLAGSSLVRHPEIQVIGGFENVWKMVVYYGFTMIWYGLLWFYYGLLWFYSDLIWFYYDLIWFYYDLIWVYYDLIWFYYGFTMVYYGFTMI